jgi:toxin YoeB
MKVLFTERAWSDYLFWQQTDKRVLRRINEEHRLVYEVEGDAAVEEYFACRGWTPLLGLLIEFNRSKASFRNTRNCRVLGSMNDVVLLVQSVNPAKTPDMRRLNDNLNAIRCAPPPVRM